MSRKEIIILLTLAFVQFSNILDGMILMPLAPIIKTKFLIDTQHFSWLVSSFGIAAGCSALFSTFWADKFDRKKTLIILYIGFIVGTFLCAISPTYDFFLGARIFTGIFGGVCGSVILSIVGDVIPNERRAQAMGMVMMGFALAAVLGMPSGIMLANKFSWQMPFYVICGLGFIVLICLIIFIPSVNKHLQQENKFSATDFYKMVFSTQSILIALSLPAIMIIAHMGIIPYITDYSVNNLHFSLEKQIPIIYLIGGALSVINSPIVGKMADKYGRYKVFFILSIVALIPLYCIPSIPTNSMFVFVVFTCLLFVGSGGRLIPVQAMASSAVPPQYRGSFMALNSALQQFTMGITTLIGGAIITNNAKGELENYPIVGFIAIGATLLSLVIAKKIKVVS